MTSSRLFVVSVLLTGLSVSAAAAATGPAEQQATAARLAGAILVGGRSFSYLEALSDQIGARLTGTQSYQRAAEWAATELRGAGLKDVHLERFTIPSGWERQSAAGRLIAPIQRPLHVASVPWSPSTPRGGIAGEVVLLKDFSALDADKLKADAPRFKGRVLLMDSGMLFGGGSDGPHRPRRPYNPNRLRDAYPVLKQAGVLGILWANTRPNNVLKPGSGKYPDARLGLLPAADIGLEDAKLIERLLDRGPVRVELVLDNRTSGPIEVANVVADLPGRELPDEWILIGAHLDSWDLATGTQDNGTGTAMVLEAARASAALGQAPRRSLRFVLFGGEEQGLLGSRAYVRRHEGELDRLVAVLNTDSGAGSPKGWVTGGRDDLMTALAPMARTLLVGLGGGELSPRLACDTDYASFMVRGVPAINLWVDVEHYPEIHHLGSDTLDKVAPLNLAAGSAIIAVTAHALAEQSERIAPRLDVKAVEALLEKTDQRHCKRELDGEDDPPKR